MNPAAPSAVLPLEEKRRSWSLPAGIPAHSASDGTLLALALVTALHAPGRPRLLLLDDLEHSLHPRAQHDLVDVIRGVLAEDPSLQVVATTHSPYLVDALEPEEVVVVALRQDGTTAARRLSDHPDAARALQVLTSGEAWSAEGESWVTEAAPGSDG